MSEKEQTNNPQQAPKWMEDIIFMKNEIKHMNKSLDSMDKRLGNVEEDQAQIRESLGEIKLAKTIIFAIVGMVGLAVLSEIVGNLFQ